MDMYRVSVNQVGASNISSFRGTFADYQEAVNAAITNLKAQPVDARAFVTMPNLGNVGAWQATKINGVCRDQYGNEF
jgi:hypothetical protein